MKEINLISLKINEYAYSKKWHISKIHPIAQKKKKENMN